MAESHTLDEERAYIENLLNTRFNYYLLFVSVLLVPIAGDNPLSQIARAFLLGLGGVVSLLMVYMVVRTKLLLDELLSMIADNHPYKQASKKIKDRASIFTRNANDIMILLVGLIALFFICVGTITAVSPGTFFKSDGNVSRTLTVGDNQAGGG